MSETNSAELPRLVTVRGGMESAPSSVSDQHVFGLDLLRCFAALLVAAFHLTRQLPGAETLFPFGWVGVQVFFVISGYVIAYSARQSDAVRFLTSRFLRLYPTAWIAAALSIAVVLVTPAYYFRAVQIYVYRDSGSLLNSVLLTGPGITASYWTLPVELAFYLCVVVLLWARPRGSLRYLAVGLTLYSLPYIVLLGLHHLRVVYMSFLDFGLGGWNALLLRHGPFFALGLFVYGESSVGLSRSERVGAGLAICLAAIEIAARCVEQLEVHSVSELVPLGTLMIEAEMTFGLALLAMMASVRTRATYAGWTRPFVRAAGLSTYPFYLLHEVFGGAALFVLLRARLEPSAAVAGALGAVILVAVMIATTIEPAFRRAVAATLARLTTRTTTTGGRSPRSEIPADRPMG